LLLTEVKDVTVNKTAANINNPKASLIVFIIFFLKVSDSKIEIMVSKKRASGHLVSLSY
jgi:hypothetical protein